MKRLLIKKDKNHCIFWGAMCFLILYCNEGFLATSFVFGFLVVDIYFLQTKGNLLQEQLSLAFNCLSLFVLYQGIMIFFANAPKLAFYDFTQLLVSFSLLLILLCFQKTKQEIASMIVVACSFTSFFSLDLISTRWFSTVFQIIMGLATGSISLATGLEPSIRITSLFENPNIFAGMTGVAILFALSLVLDSSQILQRRFYLFCLFLNSTAFLLAFSLGASGTFFFALLLYFCFEKHFQKLPLLLILVETFLFSLSVTFIIYATSFSTWTKVNIIPDFSLFLGGFAYILFHETVCTTLTKYSMQQREKQKKFSAKLFIPLCSLLSFSVFLSISWTGAYTFHKEEILQRSTYLPTGAYSLEINSSDSVEIIIESQSKADTARHLSTVLYHGTGEIVEFEVPDDSIVLHLTFFGEEDTVLESATFSNGQEMKLKYYLLPGFISTRLQGIWANQNFLQRFVFFEDGLKVFAESPIFGSGMGAFASSLFRVQSFYYETAYVHNHYIQVLLEAGIVGFSLFLLTLMLFFQGLWWARGKSFSAVGMAVFAFITTHATVELAWSSGAYQIILFLCFAFFLQLDEKSVPKCLSTHKREKKIPVSSLLLVGLSFYLLLFTGNFYASLIMKNADSKDENFPSRVKLAVTLDSFAKADHMVSFLSYTQGKDEAEIHQQAESYIQWMRPERSNIIAYYIASYYASQGEWEKVLENLQIYVNNRASHPETWNTAFTLWFTQEDSPLLEKGVELLYQQFLTWDDENIGSPVLEGDLLEKVRMILEKEGE